MGYLSVRCSEFSLDGFVVVQAEGSLCGTKSLRLDQRNEVVVR